MNSILRKENAPVWLPVLAILLNQLVWPYVGWPLLLAPALLWGLQSLQAVPLTEYLLTSLLAAGLGWASGGYSLAIAILLQFSLWFLADRRKASWSRLLSLALPPLLLLILQRPEELWPYLLAILSAFIQYQFFFTLNNLSRTKINALLEQQKLEQKASDLDHADFCWRQLRPLQLIDKDMNYLTDATYDIYQEAELQARANPLLAPSLPDDILRTAKDIHKIRLDIGVWRKQQQALLGRLLEEKDLELGIACRRLAPLLNRGENNGLQKVALSSTDLPEGLIFSGDTMFPLLGLLLFICRQGIEELNLPHTEIRISGFRGQGSLRLVISLTESSAPAGSDWPQMAACELGPAADYAAILEAVCQRGATKNGGLIYTVEFTAPA